MYYIIPYLGKHLPSQRDPLTQMSQLGEEAGARVGVSLGFENYSM